MQQLNALIFDDHKLFATSFSLLLKTTKSFNAVSICESVEEIEAQLINEPVSHLFIDYLLPGIDALSVIKNISVKHPAVKIIVVSSITNAQLVYQLQKAGANGFVSKNSGIEQVIECIAAINTKKYFICKYLRNEVLDLYLNGKEVFFTDKELKIIKHIGNGDTIEVTAQKMNLSRHTVVSHRRNMMEKFKVNSVASLLKIAMEMGVIA